MKDYFELGQILKPQGIRGELKAELYTDNPDRVRDLAQVLLGDPPALQPVSVAGARTDGRFAYLKLNGVCDRDAAEKLRGKTLYIRREDAAPIPAGSFYISDLIGLVVETDTGEQIGMLKDVLQTGAADVYVVSRTGREDLLFPAADGVFVERNPQAGRIVLSASRLSEVAEV